MIIIEQHFLTIEEFNEKLNKWTGKNIKITKQEIGDYDEALIELETISYSKDTRRIDDYEAMHTLQLNGMGRVENEDNNLIPLPSSSYEIPLEDTTHYQFDGSHFALNTERGTYTIELAD